MVAKKKPITRPQVAPALIFRKEWIFDPAPPWLKLNRAALTRINQLKTQFAKDINEVIAKGQQ
jgi:hypothetical protein